MKSFKTSASPDLSEEAAGGCAPVRQGSSRKQRQWIQGIVDLTHKKGSKFLE